VAARGRIVTPGAPLRVGEEVRDALEAGRGVVALETSVIGQGLPHPRNEECVRRMSEAIRTAGAVPAWIGAVDGEVVVGLGAAELVRLADPAGGATKVTRGDLPMAVARRALGATTVGATIWAAARAGVEVGATGGIGGVHPAPAPGPDPGRERGALGVDVSADLLELARTPGLLVCSGPKSIVDPVATAERLEELGVAVVGYGVDRLPFFLAREAPVDLEHRVGSSGEAAAIARAARDLEVRSTVLLCNPVPANAAMDADEVAAAVAEAERRAGLQGARGAARTPFLLAALADITGGGSLEANLALLEDNARVAGLVAAAMAA
jgi:pseudouridine-5'-phosphate glycosidase